MKRGVFALIVCVVLLSPVAPTAGAGLAAQPDRQAVPEALFRDDFTDTSGLEEFETLVAEGGYLQVPPQVEWFQDTFADFYPGSGVGVDLYSLPGAIILSRFSPNVRVNDVAGGTQVQVDVAFTTRDDPATGYVYAAWADSRAGDLDIYFSRSTDAGVTWEAGRKLNLQAGAGDQVRPAITAQGSRVHVAWEDADGVHHTRSQDYGATWLADSLLVPGGSEADIALGSSGGLRLAYLLYVAEESPGDPDVFCLRSTDDGLNWDPPQNVVAGEPAAAVQHAPSVAMAPGTDTIWAAWEDDRDGDWNIYAGRRWPSSWSNQRVDSGPAGTFQGQPVLTLAPSYTPLCLWTDDRNGATDLYWAYYVEDVQKWTEVGALTGPGAAAGTPAAVTFGPASWAGWTAAPPGDYDTAWARRYDGTSWGPPLLAPDHHPGATRSGVALAQADIGQALVAALWSDDRSDAGDIYAATSDGNYQAFGVYTSTVHDFGDLASWEGIVWTGDNLPDILLTVRSGDIPTPDPTWSDWTEATNGGIVPAPVARYLQYRARLSTTMVGQPPALESVRIAGRPRSGWGISVPIGQCVAAWDGFSSGGYAPPGTTLTLGVLDISGTALYTDVTTPFDLSALPGQQYSRLRLRVDMARSTTDTPFLDWWQVTWAEGSTHAAFSWEPQSIYTPTLVQFTNLSTGTVAPVAFLWEFGDGLTSTLPGPAHQYTLPGSYTVTLQASGECGADVATATLSVQPAPLEPPVAAFAHGPLCPGEEVAFSDQSSGAIWWRWAFGDGGQSTLQNPTHVYSASGDYSLTLTVSNTVGSDRAAEWLAVRPAPTAAFTWTASVLTAAFTSSVSGDPALQWDFGDGYTSTVANPTHTYALAGSYSVTLGAANACAQAVASGVVAVSCTAVTAPALAWTPPGPRPGDVVTFTAAATGSPPLAYTWDFGDGAAGRGAVVTHAYALSATFTVALTATNPCGTAGVTDTLRVIACTAPAGLALEHSPRPAHPGQAAYFTATLAAGSPPLTYTWSFGDGTPPASGPHVAHAYAAAGAYTATAVVENGCGSVQGNVPVEVVPSIYWAYLPVASRNYYGGDNYEPDDSPGQARWLPLDSPQRHDFAPEDDVDWVYLNLTAGVNYYIQTRDLSGGADTKIFLYYTLPITVSDNDDCTGFTRASCITYAPTISGRYYLEVKNITGFWGPGVGYTLEMWMQ
jgi:PKD repeat protein